MSVRASVSVRGGSAATPLLLAICVLALWAAAEAGQAKPAAASPPTVTVRSLIAGTYQEVQRYAESVLGSGVVRSAAEVRSDAFRPHPHRAPAFHPPPPPLNSLFLSNFAV